MIAIGSDVHKGKCLIAEQGVDGRLQMWPSTENTREDWLKSLGRLPPDAEIALEVSTSGYCALNVLSAAFAHARKRSLTRPA
jgi:hypothetical protein